MGKPDPKTLLLAQVFIPFFMSGTMSAFMGILHMGFGDTFLGVWPRDRRFKASVWGVSLGI